MAREEEIRDLYRAFNARDADAVIAKMAPDVRWPNGWEGGYVHGHDAVRDYWQRQWGEIDPRVEPIVVDEREEGSIVVRVHQVIRDLSGGLLADAEVRHVYRFEDDLIVEMTIEEA